LLSCSSSSSSSSRIGVSGRLIDKARL
jgi:hypothetical protein